MRACDISMDSLRKLITWKAAVPAQGGGGRGRVRLWKTSQIARICVTSRIANAGFSLRMAHTMAYALPLDDMLSLYDLDLLDSKFHTDEEKDKFTGINLFSSEEIAIFPHFDDYIGHVLVINNKYVYTDALGSYPTLWGVLDWEENKLAIRKQVSKFYWGRVANNWDDHPKKVGISEIDHNSLLVIEESHEKVASENSKYFNGIHDGPDAVPYMLYSANDYGFSSTTINLYIGLKVMVRRLLDLPYRLVKHENDFSAEESGKGDVDQQMAFPFNEESR